MLGEIRAPPLSFLSDCFCVDHAPMSPPTLRQIHLFFRTDAVKKLQSRRCGLPTAPPVSKHSQIVLVILIAFKTTRPARSCDFKPKSWAFVPRQMPRRTLET